MRMSEFENYNILIFNEMQCITLRVKNVLKHIMSVLKIPVLYAYVGRMRKDIL